MIHLVGWVAVCIAVGLTGLRWPTLPTYASLATVLLVPIAAGHRLTGIPYGEPRLPGGLHPAVFMIAAALAVQIARDPRRLSVLGTGNRRRAWFALLVVVALALVLTGWKRPTYSLAQTIETLVGPLALVALVGLTAGRSPAFARRLPTLVGVFALAIATFAILEYGVGHDLVWGADYAVKDWSRDYARHGYRATTTLDHPLNTAAFLVASIPLVQKSLLPGRYWGLLAGLVLLAGVAATGSRVPMLIGMFAFAAVAAVTFRRRGGAVRPARQAATVALGLAVFAGLLTATPLGNRLKDRLADRNSGYLRMGGLRYLAQHLGNYLLVGRGSGAGMAVSGPFLHQPHSFESAPVLLIVDLGLPAVIALYVGLLLLAAADRHEIRSPAFAAPVLVLLCMATYSSFGSDNGAGYLVAIFVALGLASAVSRTAGTAPVPRMRPPGDGAMDVASPESVAGVRP